MAKLVDARDLKSLGPCPYGFDPRRPHQIRATEPFDHTPRPLPFRANPVVLEDLIPSHNKFLTLFGSADLLMPNETIRFRSPQRTGPSHSTRIGRRSVFLTRADRSCADWSLCRDGAVRLLHDRTMLRDAARYSRTSTMKSRPSPAVHAAQPFTIRCRTCFTEMIILGPAIAGRAISMP